MLHNTRSHAPHYILHCALLSMHGAHYTYNVVPYNSHTSRRIPHLVQQHGVLVLYTAPYSMQCVSSIARRTFCSSHIVRYTGHSTLFHAYLSQRTARYPLHIPGLAPPLYTERHTQHTTISILYTTHRPIHIVHRTLRAAHYTSYPICHALHTTHCLSHTV